MALAIILGMLSFETPHGQFNYRVAAVIMRKDEVLLQVIGDQPYWCLPGGRVDFGESGEEAMRREIVEELGVEPRIERLLWMVENIYRQRGTRFHEASLYYLASLPEGSPEAAAQTPWKTAEEDGTPLLNQWHPVDGLEAVYLLPTFLRTRLRNLPPTLEYILHRDP
ncbi:MAG TPA: NUDIX domain-containing protein [Dehalococcoidia bacterium]|nr:NUDIX domain-containing protein [Dehalococcoidia bacterium]